MDHDGGAVLLVLQRALVEEGGIGGREGWRGQVVGEGVESRTPGEEEGVGSEGRNTSIHCCWRFCKVEEVEVR